MQKNDCLQIPAYAFNDFLIIINAYGAFLKERELVKNFNKEELSKKVAWNLNDFESDPYSWEAREYGISTGLSRNEIKSFKNNIDNLFEEEKNKMVNNLISTEKYFKKLKYKFVEKYPKLESTLKAVIKEHQESFQEHKRKQYQNHNAIIKLSERFISFFHFTFGGGNGAHLAYLSFSRKITNKFKTKFENDDRFLSLERLLDFENPKNSIKTLEIEQIHYIATILNDFISHVKYEDLSNGMSYICKTESGELTIAEKADLAEIIIAKNFNRFKKLYSEYKELRNKSNNLL